jgi:ribonuclease HI
MRDEHVERRELLRLVYQSIDWQKLYQLAPHLSREQVDEAFRRLAEDQEPEDACASASPKEETAAQGLVPGRVRLYCDGSASGNPGPAGIGMVLCAPDGTELHAWGAPIGRATNNAAEYKAVIEGLSRAIELGVSEIEVLSDSELMVRQITGAYKVKSPALAELHARAVELLSRFERWGATYIPRSSNRKADQIANAQIRKAKKNSS